MIGVRFSELGFEGRCGECLDWWPFEAEFWPVPGLRRVRICRACRQSSEVGHRYRERIDRSLTHDEWTRLYKRDWMRRYRARQPA